MTTSTTDAEAIARIISRAMLDNPTGGTSEERAQKRRAIAAEYASIIADDLASRHEAQEPVAHPKIMYVCECCYEHNSEACGHDRRDIYVTPDGKWLCENCIDAEDIPSRDCVSPPLLYTAPPADAGMRPTPGDILECISIELSVMAESWAGTPSGLGDGDDVAEYLTGTVWANLAEAIDTLTAPGGTKSDGGGTKSDGACLSSLPSGESEPLVTTASAPSDPAQEPEAVAHEALTLLTIIEDECLDVRCHNEPTGGDDYDVGWEVIEHYMAEPNERVIGRGSSPVEALREAALTLNRNGGRHG